MGYLSRHYLTEQKTVVAIKMDLEGFSNWAHDESDFFEVLDKINILEEVITNDFSRNPESLLPVEKQVMENINILYKQSKTYNRNRSEFDFEKVKNCLKKIEIFLELVLKI